MYKIVTIQGPTAVGKSRLTMDLALALGTEIISADSRQVYKLLDIGTAKPTPEEQRLIRHHLIDTVYPDQQFNAGDFCRETRILLAEFKRKKLIPLISGGTGFYIKALQQGLAEIPTIPESVRKKIETEARRQEGDSLHHKLEQVDPDSARKIEKNDIQKLIRALEVFEFTGKPISQFWKDQKSVEDILSFNILLTDNRDKIYKRIDKRLDNMMNRGLLQEIRELLKSGYSEHDPGMITVGYREFYPYFKNRKSREECLTEAKKNTRNYAKRQITWYKKIDFDLTLTPDNINISYILNKIRNFVSGSTYDHSQNQ